MPGTPFPTPLKVCDACRREVTYVRGSFWHGDSRICVECFYMWYDPDSPGVADLGNAVRKKHGLPLISEQV